MPISIPVAMMIASAATTGSQVYLTERSNKRQEKAFNASREDENRAFDQQLALERERAAEDKRRYEAERQWAMDQQTAADARRKPYDDMRFAALSALASRYGVQLPGAGNPGAPGGATKLNPNFQRGLMDQIGQPVDPSNFSFGSMSGASAARPLANPALPTRRADPAALLQTGPATGGMSFGQLMEMAQMMNANGQPQMPSDLGVYQGAYGRG